MQVIPTVNCEDFECVKNRLAKAVEMGARWVQIDISDGKFTPVATWNEPERLSEVRGQLSDVNIEVHLMVEKPEKDVERWLRAGVKRIIVHLESEFDFEKVKKLCEEYDAELILALKPETPVEKILPYVNGQMSNIRFVQLLAVEPGPSGQRFQPHILDKARVLLKQRHDVTIEVDGGINDKTARLARDAGVHIVASGSYIFGSSDPKTTYKRLVSIN